MNILGINKFQFVRKYVLENNLKSVLDVGCRDCILKKYIIDVVDVYKGCDLFQNETNSVDYVLNFENGLPINDATYDCVIALDLVEHLNGLREGLEELLRVTNKDLIVMLPNMSHIYFRLKFLFSGKISGKYSLNINNSNKDVDRHRWFTAFSESDQYMIDFAKINNLKLIKYNYIGDGKKIGLFAKIGKLFLFSPSLYAWGMLYVLKK